MLLRIVLALGVASLTFQAPAQAAPAYQVHGEYLKGSVVDQIDRSRFYIRDANGGIERVRLTASTRYYPHKFRLKPGLAVVVLGEPKADAFVASEVDAIAADADTAGDEDQYSPSSNQTQTYEQSASTQSSGVAPVAPGYSYPAYPMYQPYPTAIYQQPPTYYSGCPISPIYGVWLSYGCSPFISGYPVRPVIVVTPPVRSFPRPVPPYRYPVYPHAYVRSIR
jgi:hypothetical protein